MWEGRRIIFSMWALFFNAPVFDSLPSLPPGPPEQASVSFSPATFFNSVHEADVPLHPTVHPPSAVHGLPLDAGPMPMNTPSLRASSSDPPALPPYNRESPAILPSSRWNSETTGSSAVLPEAEPSRVNLASIPSSRVTGAIKVPHNRMNRSSPSYQWDLQFGYGEIDTGGRTAMSSMSGSTDDLQGEMIAEPCLAVSGHGRPDNSYPGKRPSSNYGPKVVGCKPCNKCKGT
jgi:hypothetical protein